MLHRFSSLYVNFISPLIQQTWKNLPTIKLPSAKKVALYTAALIIGYKIYRSFQSLKGRVSKLEVNLATANETVKKLEGNLVTANDTIKKLEEGAKQVNKKLESLNSSCNNLIQSIESKFAQLGLLLTDHVSRINTLEIKTGITSDDGYSTATDDEEEENPLGFLTKTPSSPPPNSTSSEKNEISTSSPTVSLKKPSLPNSTSVSAEVKKTPLENWKTAFPGSHISVKLKGQDKRLSGYLMETIFRSNEIQECIFDESTGTFTLKYGAPKIIYVKGLPQTMWDRMPKPISVAVSGLLKVTPGVQISEPINGQFVKTEQGTNIVLDKTAIFMPQTLKYTAYLKSIFIPDQADGKLYIEAEHNSWLLPIPKAGGVPSQLFVDIIDLNLSAQ